MVIATTIQMKSGKLSFWLVDQPKSSLLPPWASAWVKNLVFFFFKDIQRDYFKQDFGNANDKMPEIFNLHLTYLLLTLS